MGALGGAVNAGPGSRASACTAGVARVTTTAASTTDEAPAMRQIPSGVFRLVLRVFLRITIRPFYQLDTVFPRGWREIYGYFRQVRGADYRAFLVTDSLS